jgi:hypothetical protein
MIGKQFGIADCKYYNCTMNDLYDNLMKVIKFINQIYII